MTDITACLARIKEDLDQAARFERFLKNLTVLSHGKPVDELVVLRTKLGIVNKALKAAEDARLDCDSYIRERNSECTDIRGRLPSIKSDIESAKSGLNSAIAERDKDSAKTYFETYTQKLNLYDDLYKEYNQYVSEINTLNTEKKKCNSNYESILEKHDAILKTIQEYEIMKFGGAFVSS